MDLRKPAITIGDYPSMAIYSKTLYLFNLPQGYLLIIKELGACSLAVSTFSNKSILNGDKSENTN